MAAGVEYKINTLGETFDLRQNTALGADVADTVRRRYGAIDYEYGIKSASTDFVSGRSFPHKYCCLKSAHRETSPTVRFK